jgi:hypothetical protein
MPAKSNLQPTRITSSALSPLWTMLGFYQRAQQTDTFQYTYQTSHAWSPVVMTRKFSKSTSTSCIDVQAMPLNTCSVMDIVCNEPSLTKLRSQERIYNICDIQTSITKMTHTEGKIGKEGKEKSSLF